MGCHHGRLMLSRFRAILGRTPAPSPARRKVPLAEYDKDLQASLSRLPRQTQAAFAAACAERLFPAYAAYLSASQRDDGGLVREALDLAWDGAHAGEVVANDPNGLCERCIALIPADGADETIPPHADDAIAAAVYALQAAAGLDEHAAGWAAQRVMD